MWLCSWLSMVRTTGFEPARPVANFSGRGRSARFQVGCVCHSTTCAEGGVRRVGSLGRPDGAPLESAPRYGGTTTVMVTAPSEEILMVTVLGFVVLTS